MRKFYKYLCVTLIVVMLLVANVFAGNIDDPYGIVAPTTDITISK